MNYLKKSLALAILFVSTQLSAQTEGLTPFDSFSAEKVMGSMLTDSTKTVVLGEDRHGQSSCIKANAEIIEYLVKIHEFEYLFIESNAWNLFDDEVVLSNEDKIASIYSLWSNTQEFRAILELIRTNKLKVIGYDSRLSFNIDPSRVIDYVKLHDENSLSMNHDDLIFSNLADLLQNEFRSQVDSDAFLNVRAYLEQLLTVQEDADVMYRINLLINYLDQLRSERMSPSRYVAEREIHMSENVTYLLNKYDQKKVIVFGASLHTQRGFTQISDHATKNVGDVVHSLKPNSKSIQTSVGKGNHWNGDDVYSIHPKSSSKLFKALDKKDVKFALIDLQVYSNRKNWLYQKGADLSELGDFVLYINHTTPSEKILEHSSN